MVLEEKLVGISYMYQYGNIQYFMTMTYIIY